MAAEPQTPRGVFLTLLALRAGPKHGYEISTYLSERSEGFFSLPFGSLYPILHRLEKQGQIKGRWSTGDGAKKKVYELTAKGEQALRQEQSYQEAYAGALAKLLGGAR